MDLKGEIMSKSGLAIVLSKLKGFKEPKVSVEQYLMDSEIGASILWEAYMKGNLSGKVADLGCGTGILGLGALLLGAKKVFFVDSDENAIEIAKNNLIGLKSEFNISGEAVFLCIDVNEFKERVDTVVQNPPFGIKMRHADRVFLEKAMRIGDLVYSFHKSESKDFIEALSKDIGFKILEYWEFMFPLKSSYSFHRRKLHQIKVGCWCLRREK